MLGETHRKIAKRVADELKLSEREASLLGIGSISPDSWENFPHHKEKELEIIQNILRSRILFLEGDDECYHQLGVALHYIQDRWTLRPRLRDKHTTWEMQIDSAGILDDFQLEEMIKNIVLPTKAEEAYISFLDNIKKGIEGVAEEEFKEKEFKIGNFTFKIASVGIFFFALLDRPTTWSAPILDLNFADRISREVSRLAVLSPNKQVSQLFGQVSNWEKEKTDITPRIKGFPESYFEKEWNVNKVDYTVSIDNERLKEIEAAIKDWKKEHPYAIYYSISISRDDVRIVHLKVKETILDERIVKKRHWLFRNKEVTKKISVPKQMEIDKFRLSIEMKITWNTAADRTEQYPLPQISIDFSTIETASYVREAYKKWVSSTKEVSHWHKFLDGLVEIKIPEEHLFLTQVLSRYQKDIERANYLSKTINDLKKQIIWDDRSYLRSISMDLLQRILRGLGK